MVSAVPSRLARFSLRALFIFVTAICCFLAYEVNWIVKRRNFRAQHVGRLLESGSPRYAGDPFRTCAPSGLWLFGEKGVHSFDLYVNRADIKFDSNGFVHLESSTRDYIKAIHWLFPEADIYGLDENGEVFENMSWVWQFD